MADVLMNKPMRDKQVTCQMSALQDSVSSYEDLVNRLFSALTQITRPESQESKTPRTEDSNLVPLAHEIKGYSERIDLSNERLNTLLELLEI